MRSGALTLRFPIDIVDVVDGDTVRAIVKDGNNPFKIRLHGIDAPELDQQYGPRIQRQTCRLARREEHPG